MQAVDRNGIPRLPGQPKRGKQAERSAEWKRKHKVRNRSRSLVREGKIIPLNFCELCGTPAGVGKDKITLHHENYDRPEEVWFVCEWCHSLLHMRPAQRLAYLEHYFLHNAGHEEGPHNG